MSEKKYKNGPSVDGFININTRKQTEKAPEWNGIVPVTKEMLQTWVERVREGKPIEMKIALWDRTVQNGDRQGQPYKYIRIEASLYDGKPKEETKEEKPAAAQPPADAEFDDDIPF